MMDSYYRQLVAGVLAVLAGGCGSSARTTAAPSAAAPSIAEPSTIEASAVARFDAVKGDRAQLVRFLHDMPKGGDLHNHVSGAVYAESYVRWAAEDGLCVSTITLAAIQPPCASGPDRVPAAQVLNDSARFAAVVDAWSMRNWQPGRETGADHFFGTFLKFSAAATARLGDILAEGTARAAAQNVSYMELMLNAENGSIARLGARVGWNPDLSRLRQRVDSAGLLDSLRSASRALDRAEARRRELLRCGTAQADPGCDVVVRYIYQVTRNRTPQQVFAQILAGFEWTAIDSRVVGFNLVAPEHDSVAVRDFSLHMSMIDQLHQLLPNVPITLHAGELAEGVAPREVLRSHIRQSIEQGHARRIGHGVDVLLEDDSDGLLREMAERRVLVEIALTSNDLILGVRGARHPLATYLRYGVPVALATDDPGVSRSDMTREFLAAVEDQHLDYRVLKMMVRNSLEYAFVEGRSLWANPRAFTPVVECATASGGLDGASCGAYVGRNLKARLQRDLEMRLTRFEQSHGNVSRF